MPSSKPPTKEAAALLELERRMMAGDTSISPDVGEKIKAKLDAYRTQGLLPKSGGGGSSLTESQATASIFYRRAAAANKNLEATVSGDKPRGVFAQSMAEAFPRLANAHSSPDRQMSQQAKDDFIAASLRKESGAAIGPDEYVRQDRIFFPQPGETDPAVLRQKAEARANEIEGLRIAAGPGALISAPTASSSAPVTDKQGTPPAIVAPGATGTPPPSSGAPPIGGTPLPPIAPDTPIPDGAITDLQGAFGGEPQGAEALAPPQLAPSTNGVRTEIDPELEGLRQHVAGMVAAGASAQSIRDTLKSAGMDLSKTTGIDELVAFRKANPTFKGPYVVNIGQTDIPMSATRSALSSAAASPVGAYGITTADTILGGGLDEIAPGNTALNRMGIDAVEAAHPTATAFGTAAGIAGNVATTMGGEGLLARGAARYAPRLARFAAPIADTAYGAATGALSNNDDRLTGALTGGLAGFGGGVLGRTATRVVGGIVSPTGGTLGALYDRGVRPTIGQRFGGAANWLEETAGGLPFVGGAVRGARQQARDQFETGAFNDALGDIGQSLPADIRHGPEAHAFMQQAFNDEYADARAGMQFVPDPQFRTDLGRFQQQVTSGVLNDQEVNQVRNILTNAVQTRLNTQGGALSGDAYKEASSEIAAASRTLSRTNPAVADALNDYAGIFDDAARRNSLPDAVARMDAADTGYAKAVRIENASARAGGDPGRFTPAQFDRAVQQTSGGVRSRAYLRGDALMQDYADAGRSLLDRVPNSGSPERVFGMAALTGGLGYVNPTSLVAPALVGAAYAPGARDVVAGALAPRAAPELRTLGDLIRQRAQIAGAGGTALGTPAYNYVAGQ